MQQVKIYTASPSDLSPPVQSESFCVDMVLASDYAELEEKFMALAAENAGLKAAKEIIRHLNVNREEANFCGIDDCYIDDAVAAMITPVTDAFLAEVRAIELDSLAGVAETMLIKFSNQQCSSDMHEVVGWKMILQQAANRAAQLRKGVAQ
ncbi:TPA: hypothetical protein G9B64_001008 [Salmonella enterica]|uniref:Ead/Ea22-like family protein n=1 Tax=Salmonella enterica TaxID=28901 RepID=A0A749WIM8_SALER|nr:hypothetical protein [Salmonella enterica]